MLKTIDLRKEIDMAIGRFGPEAQVEKRILRSSASDGNYELDFQYLEGAKGAKSRKGRIVLFRIGVSVEKPRIPSEQRQQNPYI